MRRARSVVLTLLALVPASLCGQSLRTMAVPEKVSNKDSNAVVPKGTYSVFADGNLKDVLGKKEGASSPSGSLGASIATHRITASFLINAVGAAAPVDKDFGSSLLAPASGSGLSAGLAELRYALKTVKLDGICAGHGIRLYGSVSSARWKRSPDDSTYIGAVIPGGGGGLYCQFVNHYEEALKDNDGKDTREERLLAVMLDAGLAIRAIAGDVTHEANDTLRIRILGTDKRTQWGIEVGVSIQYNGLKAGLTYYRFPRQIPGFSRGQVVAGFSVETALAKGSLK